jgi:hypothetical protein
MLHRLPIVPLLALALAAACEPASDDSDPDSPPAGPGSAVVVIAAGYTSAEGPPSDPDAISEATSSPWNTRAFAERLVAALEARGVEAAVVDWTACKDLACLHVPDASSTADLAVFAGPTHYGVLPSQIRDLAPDIAALAPSPWRCSALVSYETTGQYAVDSFLEDLAEQGLSTVPGLALDAGMGQTEELVDAAVEAFADALVAG